MKQTPDEAELIAKLPEQERLGTELAQKEPELATLTAEKLAFNSRYINVIGRLYAQLDAFEQEIAEGHARASPTNAEAQRPAVQVRRTDSTSWQTLLDARRRRGGWPVHDPGRTKLCAGPVPVRVAP